VLLPYALLPGFAGLMGLPLALPLLSLPSAVSLLRQVTRRPSGPALNAALAGTARLCLVWSALFAIGIVGSSAIDAGG
jgi:1,4-dihydroxy-2-naphthoate octaprenyltransferase